MRCTRIALALAASAFVLVSASFPARASDPLNSSNRSSEKDDASSAKNKGEHDELNIVPIFGGSTDIGVGGGHFMGLARKRPGYDPFVWNLESASLFTFKKAQGDGVQVPMQDVWLKLTVPRFLGRAAQLAVRPSYTWELLRYYGLGNASIDETRHGAPDAFTEYRRLHPQLQVDLRWRIVDHFEGHTGLRATGNWIQLKGDTRLATDLNAGSPEVRRLLEPAGQGSATHAHSVVLFVYGLRWDNRDDMTSTHSGQFHKIDLSLAPGGTEAVPYRYGVLNATLCFFAPLVRPKLTLATRVVFDGLFGGPPFYELARFDDTYALGGTQGVRGVPAQRYSGKVKLFGNVELRGELVHFHAFDKSLVLGVTGFFDAGRLWADWTSHPALDGTSVGLKWGVGGGVRLQSGSSFVVRADVAWSPDANPIGGYFNAAQMF